MYSLGTWVQILELEGDIGRSQRKFAVVDRGLWGLL